MRTSIHPKNLLITASNAAKTCLAGLALLLAVSAMPAIAQAPGVTLTVLDGGGPGSGGLPSGYIASRDGTLAGAVGTQIPITNVAGVTLPVGSKEDISSGNGFVRTHDVVGFNVGITPTAGAMSNVVITLDYAGVTNAAGAPINNINGNFLTANNCVIDTSGGSLFVGSKIVCTIPAIPATGFTLFAKFMVAGAAAGSIVPLPNITVSGTGFTAVTLPRASMVAPSAGDLTVLAAPNWLVKVGPAQAGQDSLYMPAMGRNGEPGYVFAYPVVVFAEGSRVGLEPLNTAGMSMDLALTSTGTAVPTTKLINWTPANTQTTSVLQFNPTYSHGGANDTSDGGGVNNIYGAGLNQTSACVSGGALFRQVGANTVPPNGYFEYRGLAAGAPASAVNNPGGAPGSPQLGGGNPLGGLTPPFGTMGGTINLGDCDLRYSGNASNVTHNTPATSPAGATHNFSMTVKGNNNSLLPLGHLNEYYSQTVGSTNNQAISPAYRVSAVQPAAFATPALSDMFNFGINPNGEDQLTPAQVAKQRWISANKDIPFYVNASDLSAAGATVTYTLVGSNISATSLSGQTNPATNLQIGPTYSMVGGTPVAANAIANKRTITIASVNLGIDKFVQSGGGRTAATGEIVAKNASGSANQYYLYTQQGQWSSWRVATSNVSNNPKYLRRMCEKIDNTRMNLMFAKDVYPSNILFHDELVMLDGVNTGNAYLTGVVSPFVSGAAGTSNDPRNLVFSPYARWKIEYGIRTTPRASDGAFTWDSSFALRSPGNPLNIRTNFPDTTGSSGGLNSLPGGPAVASQQRDANCDDDVNVTWYNTASQSLTSWKPITHRQAPGLLLQEYDSAYTGTVAINRLATADWGKVQYVRVTPVDVNGNRIYNLEISSNTTNYTALHLPSAPKSMLSYGWVGNAGTGTNAAIGAGGDAIPSVAAGSTTNNTVSPNYASVDYGLTGVQTATITNLKTAATITITPQQLYLAVTKINATTNLSMDLGTIQKYVLTPSFNAATSPAIAPETIFLHDVIPPELSFLAAAGVTYGNANITGVYTSTALGAPTGAPATGTVVEVFKDQRYGATGVLITDAGFTTLRIRLESVAYNAVLPSVSYSTQVTTAGTAVNRTVSNAVCVTSVNNQSLGNTPAYTVSSSQASPPPSTTGGAFNTANSAIGGCTASAFALNRISDVVGLSLSKIASPAKVEPGAAQKFVISYGATGNTAQYAFRVIDILPFNGDNTGSTSFRANALANATTGEPAHFQTTAGNFNLTSGITVTPVGSSTNSPPPYIILYTADARNTVNGDPGHTTNWPLTATGATSQGTNVAATTWCTESGGVFTYNRGASARPCPTSFAGVSAFMVEHDTALAGTTIQSTLSYRIDVDGITAGSLNGQWTGNSTRGVSSSAPMVATPGLIPTKYAGIQFATQAISGNVYRDLNNDGVKNVLDNGVPNVLVRLEKLTGAGGTVVAGKTVWTFTTAAGGYNFGCLPNAAATAFDFNGCTNTGTLFLENGTSGNRNTTAEVAATSLYQGVLSGYYKITEYQPNGYVSASNNLGTCGGTATAYTPSAATNEITDIQVSAGLDCINYRFGEIEREISVSKVGTNPRKIAGFAYKFAVDYAITVKNTATGAFAASNVQVNDNVMRTFQRGGATPTVVVSGLVVSMAPAAGSTCTLNAAYTGLATTATSTALLSGTDSLAQGASCVINFTATVDYGTATPPTNILCSAPALTYATGTATATEALATTGSQSGCNTAYVSTNETGANTAGWTVPNNPAAAATFTGTGSYDLSNDGPLVRTSDTPTPVVWPFSSVGLAKAVKSGTAARPNPQQMGNSAFLVTYAFKLQNNSTTTDATNVQITDNFVRAFSNATQTPNARVYSVTVVNPPTQTGSSCTAISVPAAGLSASSSNSSFNFLSGLDTLKANGTVGDSCVVEVKVGIDYFVSVGNPLNTPPTLTGIVCTTPPTTGQTGCNNAVASLYPASTTVANPGVTIASAITTPMNTAIVNAPSTLLTDLSNDGIVVSNIGTSADSTPTPITYIPQQLRTRKQLAGAVTNRNVGTGIEFKVPYKVVLKNVSTVVAATNVQVVDDLRATFPFVGGSTTNPSITISTTAGETLSVDSTIAGGNAAVCAVNTAFDGLPTGNNMGLLTGSFSLAVGEQCAVKFTVVLTYDPVSTVPANVQNNNALGTSSPASSNTGAAPAVCPAVYVNCANAVAPSTDSTGSSGVPLAADNFNGVGNGTPTPVILATPAIGVAKRVASVTPLTAADLTGSQVGFDIAYIIKVQNTGSTTLTNVQVNDNLELPYPIASVASTTIQVAPSFMATSGAHCTAALIAPATAFDGRTNTAFITQTGLTLDPNMPNGEFCEIAYTVRIKYASYAAFSATTQWINNAYASSVPTGTNNTGHTNCNAAVTNCTNNIAGAVVAKSTNGADATVTTPSTTPANLTAQKLDVTKAVATPRVTVNTQARYQVEIDYAIRVKNTGTVPATNVQVIDNLTGVGGPYAGVSSATVPTYSIIAIAPANCPPAATSFNSATGVFTGMAGNSTLAVGETCIIKFTVVLQYNQSAAGIDDARRNVPTTARDNYAHASSASAPNTGGSYNATTGAWVPPSTAYAQDTSTTTPATCVTNTVASAACDPVAGDTPSVTSTSLSAPALAVVKSVFSVAQSGPRKFDFVFEFNIANTGNVVANNVRLQDYLPNAFGTAAGINIVAGTPIVQSGACTAMTATPYTGITVPTIDLLKGTDSIAAGANCVIRLPVSVDYTTNPVPTNKTNTAYVTGAALVTTVNTGYDYTTPATPMAPSAASGIMSDASDTAPPGATTSGDTANGNPSGTPVAPIGYDDPTPLLMAIQEIGVTKATNGPTTIASGLAPLQLRVPMKVVVKNTGATIASNVQAVDSLKLAFPAPATVDGLFVQGTGGIVLDSANSAAAAICAINAAPYAAASGQITFMAGNTNLAVGEKCTFTFDALVTYANAAAVPATGLTNTAFASTATGPNTGGTIVAPPAGSPVGTAPTFTAPTNGLAIDVSVDKSGCTTNCDPTNTDTVTGVPTPLSLDLPSMGVAKARTAMVQSGPVAFDITYSIVVKNNGNVVLPNAQVNDYLPHAFPVVATGVPVFSNFTVAAVGSTSPAQTCTANTAYNGTTASGLLSGSNSMPVGGTCTITVKFKVDYATVPNLPAPSVVLLNSAYGSSVPTSALPAGSTGNSGYTFTGAGTAGSPAVMTPPTGFVANDKSDSGVDPDGSNDAAPGATTASGTKYSDPTPTSFPALNIVNGAVYMDRNGDRVRDPVNELPLGCFLVEVWDAAVTPNVRIPYLAAVTNNLATYSIPGVPSNHNYVLRFTAVPGLAAGAGAAGCPTIAVAQSLAYPAGGGTGTAASATGTGQNGNATNNTATGIPPNRGSIPLNVITPPNGTSSVVVLDQNLPIDPAGVVYNSITREPVAGATVQIRDGSCAGPLIPSADLNGGTNTIVTAADGIYTFVFTDAAALSRHRNPVLCVTPPAAGGYAAPTNGGLSPSGLIPPSPTLTVPAAPAPYFVQTQIGAPDVTQNTTFHTSFDFANPTDVFHNHIPLDPLVLPTMNVKKTGDKSIAGVGDIVKYTVEVSINDAPAPAGVPAVRLIDTLPTGFRLIPNSVMVSFNGATATSRAVTGVGPVLAIAIGRMVTGDIVKVTYSVRIGVGAQLGDGTNRVRANSGVLNSLTRTFKVDVSGGVFTAQGCVAGKVYVDCNFNSVQNKGDLGIPGVRLYMEDSTYFVTDKDGKYSYCGLTPTTHIIKVDATTLPMRSRLMTSSNRNLGDAGSLILDLRNGEFARGDFIEGSCTPSLLQEVQERIQRAEASTQIEMNKGEGVPDVHKILDGLVPARPALAPQSPAQKGGAK